MSGLEVIGAVISGLGSVVGGIAANNAAAFEADQLEQKAKEERAASQRDALEKRKEAAFVQSRQQALAAASGGGASTDAPTIMKLMASTAGQGEYNAQAALYGGENRARGLMDEAKGRRMSGQASLLGGVFGGFGSMASGFGRAFG
jgi:hypothetical protein